MYEVVPKYLMTFGNVDRLSRFEQYRFFTPAILYLHGGFTDRYLQEFMELHGGRSIKIMHHLFDRLIFDGFYIREDDKDWDRALWAMEKADYELLESFLLSVKLLDRANRRLLHPAVLDMAILDPLFIDKTVVIPSQVPMLDIAMFGIDGSDRAISVVVPGSPFVRPKLKFFPPLPATVAMAKTLLELPDPAESLTAPTDAGLPDGGPAMKRIEDLPAEKQAALERDLKIYRQEKS